MKKMQIFEPAMCCSTGLCGVGVDSELLRISTVINTLKKNNIVIERFNLSNFPMEFINNKTINTLINSEGGLEKLPAVVLDGEIVITGRYPSNEELASYFSISSDILGNKLKHRRGMGIRKS
ncbi:MAG: Arsenical resistance operon trans-acting repressor ArsD [Clostridiales bacterium]|nr:Arsenical resistance operon trans-acting repressor ArsD [Clostridiales bacterium]